jgi:hypothetical protein
MLCFVVIVLFAIASFVGPNAAGALRSSAEEIHAASQSILRATDPLETEHRALKQLGLGVRHSGMG